MTGKKYSPRFKHLLTICVVLVKTDKKSNNIVAKILLFFLLLQTISKSQYFKGDNTMYWTLELASYLEDAPWPATKDELIDFSIRSGAPMEVVENLQALEDDGQPYENIEEIWPDYPTKEDFMFNEDEY
jgi:hypothetical protein